MVHVVVMGVTGCGKSTVGRAVAESLDVPFADGDDFHPLSNVDKMSEGVPLTDDDRWPWLELLAAELAGRPHLVLSCSALRRTYRDVLRSTNPDLIFVHLHAPQEVIEARVLARLIADGHFAGPGLLDSQYATLEAPGDDETVVGVDVTTSSVAEVVDQALASVRALQDLPRM